MVVATYFKHSVPDINACNTFGFEPGTFRLSVRSQRVSDDTDSLRTRHAE
jgi:hypothetical protein